MPLTKTQAKRRLHGIPMSRAYRERAEALVDDPDSLNQGGFGVCGMTSVIYSLLLYDLDKFIELLSSVFSSVPFSTRYGGPILIPRKTYGLRQLTVLHGGRLKQLLEKGSRDDLDDDYELDFILSRALGKLLKMSNESLYASQVRFSDRLVAHFSETDRQQRRDLAAEGYLKEGDLGLDRDGLSWILTYLVGARDVSSIVKEGAWAVKLVNETFAKSYRNPFAYGCILDANRFMEAVDEQDDMLPLSTFDHFTPPGHDAGAEHIVVVTGPITEAGNYYVVPIWTWQHRLTIRVSKGLLKSFFPTFVFGYFHW